MTLVSFKHNFIFLKNTKTAGTSLEIDLSARLEDDAVVTPIYPPVAGHRARNHLDDGGKVLFFNHMSAAQIRTRLGAERFNGMYRFCVEREPVEKCISHFHMWRHFPEHHPDGAYQKTWQEYCDDRKFPIDLGRYSALQDGKRVLLVDRVLRFDMLHTELAQVLAQQGLPGFTLTSRAKSGHSFGKLIRKQDVTPAQRAIILESFAPTLEATGIDWNVSA